MRHWILIDTCVWIPFLNRPNSPERRTVAKLLEEDRAALVGSILQEILVGIHRKEQALWVASQLEGLNWVDLSRADWIEASNLGRVLIKQEKILPPADLQIAAVALRLGCEVYSTDPHFDLIPDLRRFDLT